MPPDRCALSTESLTWFACPVCHATLTADAHGVVCSGCGRIYPVEDGIPALLRERAHASAAKRPTPESSSTDSPQRQ
jgi:uncharacterized protein YbaR (Trm112 family)